MSGPNVHELRKRAEVLLADIERLEQKPQDEYQNGDVIMWTRQFAAEYGRLRPLGSGGPARTYHYVALKMGEKWYITGKFNSGVAFTWDLLWEEHLVRATHMWYVTEWTEVEA